MDFELVIDEQEIINGILKELLAYLQPKFKQAATNSIQPVQDIVSDAIRASHEYQQMLPGSRTYHELGIPDIERRLNLIVLEIEKHIRVDVEYQAIIMVGNQISGKFAIHILRNDFSEILDLKEASLEYTSQKYPQGNRLSWLEWVLFGGSGTIIFDYHFAPVLNKPQSRTGMGLMFKGGSWSVQPFMAGTKRDNFLTRAVNREALKIIKAVEKEFLILDT
jgi:hypothetical protein